MSHSGIKAIVFDLGGVYFADGTTKALKQFEKMLRVPKGELDNFFGGQYYGRDYRLGKIDSEEFWRAVKERLNLDSEMIRTLEEIWHSSYTRNKGMKTLVRTLRKRYKVAALSDNIKERVEYLNKRYGLDKEFDCHVYSFEYGLLKPDKQLLEILIKRLQVEKDEVIIVDNSAKNVESFRKAGFKAIRFRSVSQIRTELLNILEDPSLL
ncbi:MAG: HAD family hydrolase [Nitrososphaeria archaeon]